MRIPPYQPTSTKGRFKGKSISETMCCPINYGGHILLDVYGWLMDCIIHINTLHIHYITIGFSHQLCYMFQSHQSNESMSMSCTRKKHLPTLKNVIVALPQVEFVLLVTKAGATWEEKLGRRMFAWRMDWNVLSGASFGSWWKWHQNFDQSSFIHISSMDWIAIQDPRTQKPLVLLRFLLQKPSQCWNPPVWKFDPLSTAKPQPPVRRQGL